MFRTEEEALRFQTEAQRSAPELELIQPSVEILAPSNPKFKNVRTTNYARLLLDSASILAAVSLASILRFGLNLLSLGDRAAPPMTDLILSQVLWLVVSLGALYSNRLYDEDTLFSGGGQYRRISRSTLEAVAVFTTVVFLLRGVTDSRGWFLFVASLTGIFLAGQRAVLATFMAHQRDRGNLRRPVLRIINVDADMGVTQVPEFHVVKEATAYEFLEESKALTEDCPQGTILLIEAGPMTDDDLWKLVVMAGDCGLPAFMHMRIPSVSADRLATREFSGRSIVKISPPTLSGMRGFEKRTVDLLLSLLAALLLSPFIGLIAIAVRISSGSPILYRQDRVGRGGRVFTMCKFRTMQIDAEAVIGPIWAGPKDQRRTSIGAFLRRYSLDELPQLWSVIRGDMSIVGPRPERPFFVDSFSHELPWYQFRHRIRPGLTGLAQAHGLRGNTSLQRRVETDNRYIEHWSLALDFLVILRTFKEIIVGKNAY